MKKALIILLGVVGIVIGALLIWNFVLPFVFNVIGTLLP